ncbi:MAG: hypothetical protein SNJ80_12370, partial [Anaerolinea sp.]
MPKEQAAPDEAGHAPTVYFLKASPRNLRFLPLSGREGQLCPLRFAASSPAGALFARAVVYTWQRRQASQELAAAEAQLVQRPTVLRSSTMTNPDQPTIPAQSAAEPLQETMPMRGVPLAASTVPVQPAQRPAATPYVPPALPTQPAPRPRALPPRR